MPTGCHVRRRVYAAVHGPNITATRNPFCLRTTRNPFTRLQSLRCFGSSISHDVPVDISHDTRRFLEGSHPSKTRPNVPLSMRVDSDRPEHAEAAGVPSGTPNADFAGTSPEHPVIDNGRTHVDSPAAQSVDHFPVAQAASQHEHNPPASAQSLMVPLPSFDNDGIQLYNLDTVRSKAEAQHARSEDRKRIAERKNRFNSRHPVSWPDLFGLLRRYTPRQWQAVHTWQGATVGTAPDAPFSSTTDATVLEQDDQARDRAATGPSLGFKGVRDFINAQVPTLSSGLSGARVPDLLEKIQHFYNNITPAAFASIPISVLNGCLRFLVEHSRLPDAVGILFKQTDLGYRLRQSTLDVFTNYAASQQHLNAMEKYLKMSIAAGFTPDAQTWVALLLAAPTEDDKREALLEMGRKGILADRTVQQAIIPLVMTRSLDAHLDTGKSIDEYVDFLSSVCGSKWASELAVDRLLNSLMSRGYADDALRVLFSLRESLGFQPGAWQLNKLLVHHVRSQDLARAVRTCVRFDKLFGGTGTSSHCGQIFGLAWRLRYYNVAKVAWKYAGWPTHEMKLRVLRSINSTHEHTAPRSRRDIWMKKAGYVICDHYPTVSDRVAWHASEVPDWMNGELRLIRHVSLLEPFSRMLLLAWHVDQEWLRDNIRQAKEIPWMLEHSVDIPIAIKGKDGVIHNRARQVNTIAWMAAAHARKLSAIDQHGEAGDREAAANEEWQNDLKKKAEYKAKRWSRQERSNQVRPEQERPGQGRSEQGRSEQEEQQRKRGEGDWWDVGWNEASRRKS